MKEDIILILKEYRDRVHNGNSDQAAKALGVNPPTFWRWINGKNTPKVETLSLAFDRLEARIYLPGEGIPGQQDMLKKIQIENDNLRKNLKKAEDERLRLEGEIRALSRRLDRYEASGQDASIGEREKHKIA